MKKLLAVLALVIITVLLASNIQAQTNTFPATGNVGIGTLAPVTDLNVYNPTSTGIIQVESPYSGTSGIRNIGVIQLQNSTTGDQYYLGIRKNGANHEVIQSVFDATAGTWRAFCYFNVATRKYEIRNGVQDIEFKNTGNTTFSNAGNVLVNAGAVGIGMGTTPIPSGVKLAVAGKVACKEVEVTLTGFPDFVFKSDYKLRSLYDVEQFIKENNHLPGVPSETEVIQKGLNLGNMNSILLQKIEELTLYMIDLKKENDFLKEQVNQLKK